jgi:anion-transporting  ArsA/GET3 family ATPase
MAQRHKKELFGVGNTNIRELVEGKRTLIVVGSGGVGKTTTSAALGVQAARLGRKVLVLTVDPAKRLATSLGLQELVNEAIEISPELFSQAGLDCGSGSLSAMMLDTKTTFDALINRYASPATRGKIMSNPFYEQASTALAGSQEYMAMEKLYEVRETSDFDLIILDTPPTSNALDFLTAPNRLEDFLGSNSIKVLTKGFRSAGKLSFGFMRMNRWILKGLNKFIGTEPFLRLLEFIESFQEMYEGFKARAHRVREIFRQEDVAFIIVSATERAAMDEAFFFYNELRRYRMPFGSLLVNRVRLPRTNETKGSALNDHLFEEMKKGQRVDSHDDAKLQLLADSVASACSDYGVLADVDEIRLKEIQKHLKDDKDRMLAVPLFEHDIHHLEALAIFGDSMFRTD